MSARGTARSSQRPPTTLARMLQRISLPGVNTSRAVLADRLKPGSITEKTIQRYLYSPEMNDVDLFIRTGGEQRTSNFLMWESAYAELYFSDLAWPDFDRRELWRACEEYARRDRRFGGAVDKVST